MNIKKIAAGLLLFCCLFVFAGCGAVKENEAAVGDAETETAKDESIKEAEAGAAITQDAKSESFINLEDGEYTADFETDSSMFHVSEALDGKCTLSIKDGIATAHVSLASKNIVNLFLGLAADAKKEGALLLEPTVDTVTYSDGMTEEVNGFDIPVTCIDEEFDLALIGKKGKWYDHKVKIANPQPK